ncbi:MAG: hypothetical protein PWQ82_1833 [Thermosediminibacterales bacterium]|nr:hypothetical protein [Thermosediminibacterales bacterium]
MVYAYYHEHFEINTWDNLVKVTCVCGKDFIWSVKQNENGVPHHCPHCNERWLLGLVGEDLTLTRAKTGAKIVLRLEKKQAVSLVPNLFWSGKLQNQKEL